MLTHSRAALVQPLQEQADALLDAVAPWQQGSPPSSAELRAVRDQYSAWYNTSSALVLEDDRSAFQASHEGTMFRPRIRQFLNEPMAASVLHDPENPNPLVSPWKLTFEAGFRDPLALQMELLSKALYAANDVVPILHDLAATFRRLPMFLSAMSQASNPNLPVPIIRNEADLQVLVHAILCLLFDDVRVEDAVSQFAGGASRVDFLLRESGVILETKMTRTSLKDRKVGEELLIDWGRYAKHPDCKGVLAIVYDPDRYLSNPVGLEHDLSQVDGPLPKLAIVVR